MAGLLPELVQMVGVGIPRPRTGLGDDLDLDLATVTVGWAAHFSRTSEGQQRSLAGLVGLRREGAKFALCHGFMRHPIQNCASRDPPDIEGEVARIIG